MTNAMEVDDEIEEGMVVDNEALVTSASKMVNSAYELLENSRVSAEEIVSKLLSLKKEGNQSSKSEVNELVAQMFLSFVSLRKANRTILLEEDRVKGVTERAKAPVDFTTLQLHNLMYEKSHYVKAIKACKDFKSKYPDIELVPEEEFFSNAPEDIKGAALSNDTAHNVMLKRLNYELFQRKELRQLQEKLEQQKKSLQETISNRKKFLSSLPSHLKSLKKASLPVQNQLGVLHTKKLKQHQSAELLPPPLYVIYSQFLAQKEAFDENIELEIVGSVKDAQAFARQQAIKDTGISTNVENSKLDDDNIDDEDDGQRRRKRPKKVPSKDSFDQDGVYQVHPLKVILHIHDDDSDDKAVKLLTLKFEYLPKLNVVCVGIDGSHEGPENNILCNLFPDDTGLDLPLLSAKLSIGAGFAFDARRPSRPYKWAQHLAGIDFLSEVPPLVYSSEELGGETSRSSAVISGLTLYRQQNRIQSVVHRVRSRKKAQLALQEQLDTLAMLKWPSLSCETVPWGLHPHICNLHAWSPLGPSPSPASSLSVIVREQVEDTVGAETPGRSGNSKEEVENAREDGELPSLVPVVTASNDIDPKVSDVDHSRRLALMAKSVVTPISKLKSPSFRKYDDDSDLLLDTYSDLDEFTKHESTTENDTDIGYFDRVDKSWENCGVKEFSLVLIHKTSRNDIGTDVKLEAKIKISMEYPLRPPLFALNIYTVYSGENVLNSDTNELYNESRAIEAEVNFHILRMLPPDQENYVLAHQIYCLAMLFDLYMDEADPSSEKVKSNPRLDFSSSNPTSRTLSRPYRGRDHRKMISWKDMR